MEARYACTQLSGKRHVNKVPTLHTAETVHVKAKTR
jgi:hypothetical protein